MLILVAAIGWLAWVSLVAWANHRANATTASRRRSALAAGLAAVSVVAHCTAAVGWSRPGMEVSPDEPVEWLAALSVLWPAATLGTAAWHGTYLVTSVSALLRPGLLAVGCPPLHADDHRAVESALGRSASLEGTLRTETVPTSAATFGVLGLALVAAVSLGVSEARLATEPRFTPVETRFAWSLDDAAEFDDFSIVGFAEGYADVPLHAIVRVDEPTSNSRAGNVVRLRYGEPASLRGFTICISPACIGGGRARARSIEGVGAVAAHLTRARVAMWSGDIFVLFEGRVISPAEMPGTLAALRPLNEKARSLEGWPAPNPC